VDNATATPRLFIAAAELAQQRHDFQGARKLLDRAIAGNPRDAGARLKRANAALIAGDHAAAHRDCLAVLAAGATVPGTICLASAMTGPGSVTRARRLLESLDAAGAASPAIASWLLATEVDLSLRDGDLPAALAQLAQALAVAPASEELRARVADLKLDAGDFGDALAATDGNGLSAALLVRRVRAAAAIDAGLARAARRQLDALLLVARRRGTGRHLREEAELALHVDRQASRAVELARLNFEQQKDTPDLRIFADAAIAAGDRQAIAYLRAWLAATGFEDTVVAAKLAQAGA
jgi:hypothetical protein